MRQITAAEVKPGMEVQFDLSGWDVKGTVATVDVRPHAVWIYTEKWCEMSLDLDSPVTVLSEPQPEEPVTLCARIVVAGRKIYRWTEDPKEPWPWRGEALNVDPVLWSWGQLCGLGPVTVVDAAPSWTAPADREPTPEVPDRIEEWDTWEDVPEGVVVTTPGLFCHYRKNQGVIEFSDPKKDPDWTKAGVRTMPRGYGPWTRAIEEPTPEVPNTVHVWPEDDTALRPYKWMDEYGEIWRHGSNSHVEGWTSGYLFQNRPVYGPWDRVTGA